MTTYMLDNEYYFVNADPLENSVERAWDILDKTGSLDEKAKGINTDNHINTRLYGEALGETVGTYGGEAPGFYQNMKTFFEENDK